MGAGENEILVSPEPLRLRWYDEGAASMIIKLRFRIYL